jgi:DNA replication protein DnaC
MERLGDRLKLVPMPTMQPTSDSSSLTEACPKCKGKPPFQYVNPEWNGKNYWDRLRNCDCADAVAYHEERAKAKERAEQERQQIEAERKEKCAACGGDGYRSVFRNDEFVSVACSCQYGHSWNVYRAMERKLVPARFAGADMDLIDPAIKAELDKVAFGDGEGVMIHGGVGTGKTFLAVAVLFDLLKSYDYREVMFATMPDLLDRIRASYNAPTRDDVLERALEVQVLVLDDLGTEKVTDWVREKVYQIINRRYNEQLCTICTTNLAPSQLAKHIGERTVSRLMEMCRVVKLDGADRRVQR